MTIAMSVSGRRCMGDAERNVFSYKSKVHECKWYILLWIRDRRADGVLGRHTGL